MVIENNIIEKIIFLRKILEDNNINIKKSILFGSFTKQQQTEYSDIDLALISDDFTGNRFEDIEKLIPFIKQVDPYIEIHPFSSEDKDNFFLNQIIKEGIEI